MWKMFWPGSPFENAHMQVYVLPLLNTLPANLLFWGAHFQTHVKCRTHICDTCLATNVT
jgi:hypothetical protein